jgi:hypothetical protein
VERETTLDAFAVGNLADGERGVHASATTGDHNAGENLDTLLAAFDNAGVDLDRIADIEVNDVRFQLLLLDFLDDVHGSSFAESFGCAAGPGSRSGVAGRES